MRILYYCVLFILWVTGALVHGPVSSESLPNESSLPIRTVGVKLISRWPQRSVFKLR